MVQKTMEQGALLVEREIDGYRPLGAFGQPVHRSYVQLRAAVAQRLNERCANLFARPQYDERSQRIRWVAPVAGEARNWRDLDPREQAERALELQILKGEFESYLAELRGAGGGPGSEAFASVLEQSLKTPNDRHLHFVGDQPVMTFWGFTEPDGEAFEALAATPAAIAPPAPAAAAAGRRMPAWLPWLLGLLLLLLLLLLLWYLWESEPTPEPLATEPPGREEAALPPSDSYRVAPDRVGPDGGPVVVDRAGRVVEPGRLRIDERGRVVGPDGRVIEGVAPEQLGAMSAEDGAATPPPELAAPPDTDSAADATDPSGDAEPGSTEAEPVPPEAEVGPVPDEPLEDQESGAAPADEAAAPAGEPLTLPPQPPGAASQAGASGGSGGSVPARFMQGQWRSQSALTDERGNRLSQTYRFDESGNGQSVIRRADGSECTAPAQAWMRDGSLHIVEQENPTCPDGQRFKKSETVCETDASGKTRCQGNGYDVQIEKVGQ